MNKLDSESFRSPVRMFGGGRRESRNLIPIEVKVLAISKIQSGRKSDTVSRELGFPVVMVDKWWLQRDDISTQYEKYCAANREDSDLLQNARKYQDSLSGPSQSQSQEEELHDLKDLDFTPEETSGKVEVESDDEKKTGQKRKKKKVENSPYKRRKRVELPTVKQCEESRENNNMEEGKKISRVKRNLRMQLSKTPAKSKSTKLKSPPTLNTVKNLKGQKEREQKPKEDQDSGLSKNPRRCSQETQFEGNESVEKEVAVKTLESKKEPQPIAATPVSSKAAISGISVEPPILPAQTITLAKRESPPTPLNETLPLSSDESKPILNFLENVRSNPSPVQETQSVLLSPVTAPHLLGSIPDVLGPPLATSSKYDLTGEFSQTPAVAAPVSRQQQAVSIKREVTSSLEYIEESPEIPGRTAESSNISSVVERYYSGIGSEPSTVQQQQNIKTERAEREVNQEEVRERSVSPPASEFPLVPVDGQGINLDLLQPSYPALRGTARGRGNLIRGAVIPGGRGQQPFRGRGQLVRAGYQMRGGVLPRGRGQPFRGGNLNVRGQPFRGGPPHVRGQPVRGGPPHVRGQPVRGGPPHVRGQPVRGGPPHVRGQPVRGGYQMRGGVLPRGRGQPVRGGPPHVRGQLVGGGYQMRGGVLPRGRGQLVRGGTPVLRGGRGQPVQPARGQVRSDTADPVQLPEKLSNMNGLSLSVIRQKPVPLPKGLRLPSGVTLSHPRGIQNQPPPPAPSQPPQPADMERKQKVSLELTTQQMEALRTLGYL